MSSDVETQATSFVELRRKVQLAQLLFASTESLLRSIQFNGRLSVVIQNGRILKSGYEEGYFRQHE
jgi:sulfur carrier protein ThiS